MTRTLPIRAAALALAFVGSWAVASSADASSFTRYHWGGGWYFKVFVPTAYDGSTAVPMMVMQHGCTQDADDFAAGTRMNALAENKNVIVVYPEMNAMYNAYDCWNWFYDYNQHRGDGEPKIINDMINWVRSKYKITSKRYTAGISAGGYMTSIMGAAYPEHARAIGIHSGGMYDAANSGTEATNTMKYGSSRDPNVTGYYAALEMNNSGQLRRIPTIVFHGTKDGTVVPKNAWQAKDQWAQTNDYADDGSDNNTFNNGYDAKNTGTTNNYSWSQYIYNDKNGAATIEVWMVDGLGHAWSGGSTSGSYSDSNGPRATNMMWSFFISR